MSNRNSEDETEIIANTISILAISVFIIAIIMTLIVESHLIVAIGSIVGGMILSFAYYINTNLKNSNQKKESLEKKV